MDNRFKFIITFERELFIFDSIETTINNDNATTRRRRRRRVGRLCRISIEICISRCTGNDVIVEYREPCIRIIKIPRENYTIRPFILSNKCNDETKGKKISFSIHGKIVEKSTLPRLLEDRTTGVSLLSRGRRGGG